MDHQSRKKGSGLGRVACPRWDRVAFNARGLALPKLETFKVESSSVALEVQPTKVSSEWRISWIGHVIYLFWLRENRWRNDLCKHS